MTPERTMAKEEKDAPQGAPDQKKVDANPGRRNFLKGAIGASIILTLAGLLGITRVLNAPAAPEPTGATTTQTGAGGFPRIKVANVSDLQANTPVSFNYPLQETPNFLVKVGTAVEDGIGPDSDIVAYSYICQHLGCFWGFVEKGSPAACNPGYTAPGPVGYCCCHGSIFDLANAGAVIGGPAPRPAPRVILEFDSSTGDIYATGMTLPTIYGHDTGGSDVTADLQGGTPLS